MILKLQNPAWYVILCAVSWFLALMMSSSVYADVMPKQIHISSKRIQASEWSARDLSASWQMNQEGQSRSLSITSALVEWPSWPKQLNNIHLDCAIEVGALWRCEDGLLAMTAQGQRLTGDFSLVGNDAKLGERLRLAWALPQGRLTAKQQVDDAWRIKLSDWRLTEVWPLLSTWVGDWSVTSGLLDAHVYVQPANKQTKLKIDMNVANLALAAHDDSVLTEQVHWKGSMNASLSDQTQHVNIRGAFHQGDLLFGDWYIGLPKRPVTLQVSAKAHPGQPWVIPQFLLEDRHDKRTVLRLSGDMRFDAEGLAAINTQANLDQAAVAWDDYLKALLSAQTSAIDSVSGGLNADVRWRKQGMESLLLSTDRLTLNGANNAWQINGLQGAWQMQRSGAPFSWSFDGLTMHGLHVEGANLRFQNHERHIQLLEPVELNVLEGVLRLDDFAWYWQPSPPNHEVKKIPVMEASLSLRDVSMPALTKQLDWPVMPGSLSATLPTFRWFDDDQVTLDGGLDVSVFDGHVRVEHIRLERLFGVAPVVVADVLLNNLDLAQLTSAFGVGSITGRLDGAIKSLRMVDFEPAAFDASFYTNSDADEPRRISQRAVGELSSVGGAGATAGIQSSVLRFFSDFGYKRIGFACRLKNDVCQMSGLERVSSAKDTSGYMIVEGEGLPQITVVGYQRRVDWPTLVNRLKAAAEGEGPKIE